MDEYAYRWGRWTYSFRAWIDERGSNVDRQHRYCEHSCPHYRLWDLNTVGQAHNIVRVIRRRRPFALGVYVGPTMCRLVRFGEMRR